MAIFHTFCVFVVISLEKNMLILFIFGTVNCKQVPCVADACKISFGSAQNLNNYTNIFLTLMFVAISEKIGLILFIFGTVIHHTRDLMHVNYTLA